MEESTKNNILYDEMYYNYYYSMKPLNHRLPKPLYKPILGKQYYIILKNFRIY